MNNLQLVCISLQQCTVEEKVATHSATAMAFICLLPSGTLKGSLYLNVFLGPTV